MTPEPVAQAVTQTLFIWAWSDGMKTCKLNEMGQLEVAKAILALGHTNGLKPEPFFGDVEAAFAECDARFELGSAYTNTRKPELIDLKPEWFDTSETEPEYEEFTIARDDKPDLKFTGVLVAEVQSSANSSSNRFSGSNGRWTVLKLYKSKAGKYICQQIGRSQWEKESDRYSGAVCHSPAEAIAFFGHGWLAKELYSQTVDISDIETVD